MDNQLHPAGLCWCNDLSLPTIFPATSNMADVLLNFLKFLLPPVWMNKDDYWALSPPTGRVSVWPWATMVAGRLANLDSLVFVIFSHYRPLDPAGLSKLDIAVHPSSLLYTTMFITHNHVLTLAHAFDFVVPVTASTTNRGYIHPTPMAVRQISLISQVMTLRLISVRYWHSRNGPRFTTNSDDTTSYLSSFWMAKRNATQALGHQNTRAMNAPKLCLGSIYRMWYMQYLVSQGLPIDDHCLLWTRQKPVMVLPLTYYTKHIILFWFLSVISRLTW